MLAFTQITASSWAPGLAAAPRVAPSRSAVSMDASNPVVIGLAADSGCGKSTFMRRVTGIFGGECKLNDIGRETNTLVSDMTTVICLDDYHKWDRTGRKSNPEWPDGITALHEACQNWDKMAADVTDLKAGKAVEKPIYNHITGELDPDEPVRAPPRFRRRLAAPPLRSAELHCHTHTRTHARTHARTRTHTHAHRSTCRTGPPV